MACVLLATACGVPISAADLALTPEPTAVSVSQTTISSRSADIASEAVQRSLAISAVATSTPLSTSTLAAATLVPLTPTDTPTPTVTLTPTPFGTPPPTPTPTFTPTPTPSIDDLVSQALTILNQYRVTGGRTPLQLDPALASAAQAYAKQMADTSWFTRTSSPHIGPDGSQVETRVASAGYTGYGISEALAAGQGTAAEAVAAWLASPAHAAIALDPAAVYVGIGYYRSSDIYSHYWVLVTGK